MDPRRNLRHDAFGAQNLDAALEALIVGQDVVVQSDGDRADVDVDGSAFDAAAAAEIEETGGFDEVLSRDCFVGKWIEEILQLCEPRFVPDAGKYLLPDWAEHDGAAVANRLL